MWLEATLAYLHLLAILSWVVFLSSTAALARVEWLNGAALLRLVTVDRVAHAAGWIVLASGLARVLWGAKGWAWTAAQPLLWAKLALVAAMLAAGWRTHREIGQWARQWHTAQQLPAAAAVATLRKRVMTASHAMLVLPLLGVLLARGLFSV